MNKRQKILTAAFVAIFTLTLLLFPWTNWNRSIHIIGPAFIEPQHLAALYPSDWNPGKCRHRDWPVAAMTWTWLTVVYVSAMLIAGPTRK